MKKVKTMKQLRRIWMFMLALCLLLTLGAPALAADQLHLQQVTVNPYYADQVCPSEGLQWTAPENHLYLADGENASEPPSYDTPEEAADYIREQMEQRNETISFYLTTPDADAFYAYADGFGYDATVHTGVGTQGDYLRYQYLKYETSADGNLPEMLYTLTFTYYTDADQEAEVTARLDQLLPGICANVRTYDRLRAIYDYICDHVVYDNEHLNDQNYHLKATAYAALINGTAVCQGYANLFYRMALDADIDARIVVGDSLNHAWNIAKIGDRYYELDATWDAGETSYDYFLRGSGDFLNHDGIGDEFADNAFAAAYPLAESAYEPAEEFAITVQPVSRSVVTTGTADFTVTATGENLSYQWQYLNPANGLWKNCSSATKGYNTATLTVQGVTGSTNRNGYQYRCVVSDGTETLTSAPATLSVVAIKTQPKAQSVTGADYAQFTVTATGEGLSYQWQYKNPANGLWKNCSSATKGYNTATLTVQGVTGGTNRDGYQYRCKITGGGTTLTSKAAALSVFAVKTQPKAQSVTGAGYAQFTVTATGENLSYQWQYKNPATGVWKNCTKATAGYNAATLTVQGLTGSTNRNGYQYRCRITGDLGTLTTKAVKLTVS